MNNIKIIISIKTILVTLALILATLLIYQIKDAILLIFASFIIASALLPIVDTLNKRMSRGWAVTFVYIFGFLILATLLVPLFFVLIDQTQEFIKQSPIYLSAIDIFITKLELSTRNYNLIPDYSQILASTSDLGKNLVNQSINITINLFTGLIAAFTLAVLVLFLVLDKKEIKHGFLRFFPQNMREKAANITSTISRKVGGYVIGQLVVMIAIGLMSALGLAIIGVKFALLLGLIAAILEIIPIVGPVLATLPAIIVGLAQDPWLALWVIVVYVIVQRIGNSFISPIIYSKVLDLHPLIIIIALLIAASTLGIVGVILAPPIAAAVYVLVQELYLSKINPEPQTK